MLELVILIFIHQKAVDGISKNDFKTINAKSYPLFKAGHIQAVLYKWISNRILMKCTCLPENGERSIVHHENCVLWYFK